MLMNRWIARAMALLLPLVSACSYGHKKFETPPDPAEKYKLRIVQSDDFGSLWDIEAAQKALALIEAESSARNTVVLMFIHGWHHNAAETDANLRNFRETLNSLASKLDAQNPSPADKISLIGVYVGWRGRSLPGLLDNVTIWGRKPAAERVGAGDLSEFIARIQKIYERQASTGTGNFMGFVLTGHSLGAQVLFKSVVPTLERSLIQDTTPFAGTGIVDRPKSLAALAPAPPPVTGVGDLVLLLNPALEAYQFERFHRLYRERTYDAKQNPVLFVVSSENDTARSIAFPVSRWFSLPFRPIFRSDEQADLFNNALGEYKPQVTHRLAPAPSGSTSTLCPQGDQTCLAKEDLSATVRASGAELSPLKNTQHIAHSPVIVADTSKDIVDGHNGIFLPVFIDFVSDYVAEIEMKKLIRFEAKKALLLKQTQQEKARR
jgi:hypothetical protein